MSTDLRMGPRWSVTPTDLDAVAAAYGLAWQPPILPLGGAVNGVVRIGSDRGDVVVRVHRPWTTPTRLASVHQIQNASRSQGIPIPPVACTVAGTTWTMVHDRLVELTPYVAHDGPALTWAAMEEAGALLGRLHGAFAAVPASRLISPAYSSYADPATALQMMQEMQEEFVAYQGEEGYEAAAATRAATTVLLTHLVQERTAYERRLPRSLIHGDYGGENVLMRASHVVAILDFDYMAERERIFDIAYTLYWTLDRLRPAAGTPHFSDADLVRAGAVLRRYLTSGAALTAGEWTALPFEMARVPLYHIAEAGYAATAPYLPSPVEQTLAFACHVPVAQSLVANAVRVRSLLAL